MKSFDKDANEFQNKEDKNAENIIPTDIDNKNDSRKLYDWLKLKDNERKLCKRTPPT